MSHEELSYEEALDRVLDKDPRYSREAYLFVQRALSFYRLRHAQGEETGHVKGPELLIGVRGLALEEFGPMARSVLASWGIRRGEDVGETVYNMIRVGLMSKTEDDRKEDFAGVMDFEDSLDSESCW